jgi:tripartite ATP-independent transporter DctM subunit
MGQILGIGGIAQKMIAMADVIVGRIRGGLAMVNILASMFFGGISGSSVADTSSIGSILIPMMKKSGYDPEHSVAVTITSSVQGIIVPPSQNMIIYSLAAGWVTVTVNGVTKHFSLDIGKLFLAGYTPGVFLGIALMILCYYLAVKRNYPRGKAVGFREGMRTIAGGTLGLMTGVIVMVGVLSGIFTATESAAVAAVYAFIITWLYYRGITWGKLRIIVFESLKTIAIVAALVTTSSAYGYLMSRLNIPQLITETLITLTQNRYVIFLIVNVALIMLGMIMDLAPLVLITTPILLPVMVKFGMDPHHFGIVLMLNLGIGLLTPPVGTTLFVGSAIGKVTIESMVRPLIPFYATMFAVVMLVTYIPQICMWLPNLIAP